MIDLPVGDVCPSGGNKTVTYDITCDPNTTEPVILNANEFSIDKCNNVIKMKTIWACPVNKFKAWYSSFGMNKYVIATIFSLIGLFYVFLGTKFQDYTVPILIALCFSIIMKSVISNLLSININFLGMFNYII